MFSSLDNAFAAYVGHGDLPDAYTTGTPTNLIMQAGVAALLGTLTADATASEVILQSAAFSDPVGALSIVFAAGNIATCRAAMAELTGAQRALQRP